MNGFREFLGTPEGYLVLLLVFITFPTLFAVAMAWTACKVILNILSRFFYLGG